MIFFREVFLTREDDPAAIGRPERTVQKRESAGSAQHQTLRSLQIFIFHSDRPFGKVCLTGELCGRRYSSWDTFPTVYRVIDVRMGIVVYSSNDTARPLLRLVGLIASVVAFAGLWSGDQKIQQEIAATRAKNRSVYAGPSVLQIVPSTPRVSATRLAERVTLPILGLLDRIPQGQYQLFDGQGRIGMLVLECSRQKTRSFVSRFEQPLTIQTAYGEMILKPIQSVSTSALIYR